MSFWTGDDPALPRPADAERAKAGLDEWQAAAVAAGDAALARCAEDWAADPARGALLEAVFGNSPFLSTCLVRDVGFACALLRDGPGAAYDATLAEVEAIDNTAGLGPLKAGLRQAKRRVALTVALADITGAWPLEAVTRRLSRFTDAALRAAAAGVLREAARTGAIELADTARPEHDSGLIILGLGKLGANELNYSSDIDLIVLFDADKVRTGARRDLQQTFVRLARNLVQTMEQRTQDGYVFRTDLRLRPDPGATPLAMSVEAAEIYYESFGQNWERAAMIKARPVAGDLAAGAAFLAGLHPFVWRRHLDFAAIEDIHSIKQQIHAAKGGGTVAVAGHNIKLGRGGIREVEFFVQTQQLIWGGRDPRMRTAGTVDTLRSLAASGRVAGPVADRMIAAYRYLRRVEHRLQMIDDQQTQTLPRDAVGLAGLAAFLGYDTAPAFEAELRGHLLAVERHYAELFEETAPLGSGGSLVFTGADHHPDTLETLAAMGFPEPETASELASGWHRGRYRAMRSTRARELLTELMPALLGALAKTARPDQALVNFDKFLRGLPAGVQLFSMFHANPSMLDLVAEIMGGAPRLAAWLSRNPLLLDGVLGADFFDSVRNLDAMVASLADRLALARDMQDVLELSRRWADDAKFRVGVQMLRHLVTTDRAELAFSDIADAVIRTLLRRVQGGFADKHGHCPGDGLAVVALGKLGGRELTATSDLDLIFIYDAAAGAADVADVADADDAKSDGRQPLPTALYYQRLGQRLISALTSLTGEGRLYEVDMRLRPSGNAGPLAVSLDGFARYQAETAWTWEHMALTRARVVVGRRALARRIEAAIRTAVCAPRDDDALLREVAAMRTRIDDQHRTDNPWRVKYFRGGLIDCEFIAQCLQLRHAHAHPEVLSRNTIAAFENLTAAGCLDPAMANELIDATRLWRCLQALMRLSLESDTPPEAFPEALRRVLAEAGGAADFDATQALVEAMAARTHGHFEQLIERPAAALPPPSEPS